MSAVEDRVARLESAVGAQALELLRTRIELQLYKALIASRRWGSPSSRPRPRKTAIVRESDESCRQPCGISILL